MIRHETIGGNPQPPMGHGLRQHLLKRLVVPGLFKQGEPADVAVQDMIGEITGCGTGTLRHAAFVPRGARVSERLPTPFLHFSFSLYLHGLSTGDFQEALPVLLELYAAACRRRRSPV